MSSRASKRRRIYTGQGEPYYSDGDISSVIVAATQKRQEMWGGWCEIESDPNSAFFNVILKELGVSGVKAVEIVSLDKDSLDSLPKPSRGLIFLFKWQADDVKRQVTTCPPDVWFANQAGAPLNISRPGTDSPQTVGNACATIALLNIVNNIHGLELGEHLQQFKEFTSSFSPALKGDAVANFAFAKRIHNSFSRKMDVLNSDMHLKSEAKAAKRLKAAQYKDGYEDDDNAHHFVAFVPIGNMIWKLDGLERQPQILTRYNEDNEDWLELVKPEILDRMARQDMVEFAVIGIVDDPLPRLRADLSHCLNTMAALSAQLRPDSAQANEGRGSPRKEKSQPCVPTGDTKAMIASSSYAELREWEGRLRHEQVGLQARIHEEKQAAALDAEKAARRRLDLSPAIYTWLLAHARQCRVRELAALA